VKLRSQALKDSSGLYEVKRRAYHAVRPDVRIAELQISRPLVTNAGNASAVFLVLQGIGQYDFVPLT